MKTRLFVSHLPASINEAQLRVLFKGYGPLKDLYIPKAPGQRIGKGMAFVELSTEEYAKKAKDSLNYYSFQGKKISVDFAKERGEKVQKTNYSGNRQNSRGKRKSFKFDYSMFIKEAENVIEEEYIPKHKFSEFPVSKKLLENVMTKGYVNPTPIQDQVIEYAIEGRDVVGLANTGTGKTAAFLIPIINKIVQNPHERAIIIVPTRELASQIDDELYSLTKYLQIKSVQCIGGANIYNQISKLRANPSVVIGTPGRLKDLINQRKLDLNKFRTFVLDEVDRMLDMGFIEDISYIVGLLPERRQSLFFSATMPESVNSLLDTFLKDPITISVRKGKTSLNVDQNIVKVSDPTKKVDILHDLLIQDGFDKVLVFGRTKRGVEKLEKTLENRGFKVTSIHGDKTQSRRQKALKDFKAGYVKILIATDVAARGLDINNVSHVINYDLPENYDDYIHRVGRTGRANKKGVALTFVE